MIVIDPHRHIDELRSQPTKMAPTGVLLGLTSAFQSLPNLCKLFDASCADHLSLCLGENGVRGLFLGDAVHPKATVLQIPLSACLRDDKALLDADLWAVRLASSLLHLKLNEHKTPAQQAWLDLLPTELTESLPIHWDEHVVRSCMSINLESAVDSSYFVRADAIHQLKCHFPSDRDCQEALDIVQTRSCRIEPGIRILAPIFDLINHGGDNANAEFFRKGDHLVVRMTTAALAGSELLIDYGESARPNWKCLLSYGFVPNDDGAELSVDGVHYCVGPETIPYELVKAVANKLGQVDMKLTRAVGAFLIELALLSASHCSEYIEEPSSRPEQLAKDLRQSQRQSLLAFASALRNHDYQT